MKKFTAILIAALLVAALFVTGASAAWDGTSTEAYTGSGTEADPYVIDTPAKLAKIREVVAGGDNLDGKYFTQTADIDLGGKEWTPIGDATTAFSGIYNGLGHKITGFSITQILNLTGLFGKIIAEGNEAGVCNLTLEGAITDNGTATFSGPSVGAIAGQVNNNSAVAGKKNAVFTNITSKVDITLNNQTKEPRAGGLFGQIYLAVVENCVNDGNLATTSENVIRLGGFTGQFVRCEFRGCVNNGNVTGTTSTAKAVNVAGFAAYCTGPAKEADGSTVDPRASVIENSINNGNISGESGANVGVAAAGFISNFYSGVGVNYCTVKNCLNAGKISAKQPDGGGSYSYAGGIFGNVPSGYDYNSSVDCVNLAASDDIQGIGGKDVRRGAIAGAFYAPQKENNRILNAVSVAAEADLPMASAFSTPNTAADKETFTYGDAAKASEKATAIRGAIAKSLTKINGIEVTTVQQQQDPGPSNPTTGDEAVWFAIAGIVALLGTAVAVKARKA